MQFAGSFGLWAFAGAATIAGGLVILYMLKQVYPPTLVPSTLLWQQTLAQQQVNRPWQKLRNNPLLWLQLLFLLLLLLALLQPTTNSRQAGRRLIFLIDQSASMNATDGSPTRLEEAKKKARKIAGQMSTGDAGMVIAFHRSAQVVQSFTQSKQEVLDAINRIKPTQIPSNADEALQVARALADPQQTGEDEANARAANVYLISDGRFPEIVSDDLGLLQLSYVKVGKDHQNVAILDWAGRIESSKQPILKLAGRIKNFSKVQRNVAVTLQRAGKPTDFRNVSLEPDEETIVTFEQRDFQAGGIYSLSIKSSSDIFPLDNQAWTVLPKQRLVKILAVGNLSDPIRLVLSTGAYKKQANVEFLPSIQDPRYLTKSESADLVIFERTTLPTTWPRANTLSIGMPPPSEKTSDPISDPKKPPIILSWKTSHPVLRFLDLDDIWIFTKPHQPVDSKYNVLMESDQGPLMVERRRGLYQDVFQIFPFVGKNNTINTNWPFRTSFSVYTMNILQWAKIQDDNATHSVRVGRPVDLNSDPSTNKLSIITPNQKTLSLSPNAQGVTHFTATDEIGTYQWWNSQESEPAKQSFAANLFNDRVSALQPREEISLAHQKLADQSSELSQKTNWWPWIVVTALIVLLVEWILFHRRLAG